MDPATQSTILKLCYVFPAVGIRDLRPAFNNDGRPVESMYFIQCDRPRLCDNGFYSFDEKQSRHRHNSKIMASFEKTLVAKQGHICIQDVPNPVTIKAFLSLAHANRTLMEMRACVEKDLDKIDFAPSKQTYERCVRLSFDVASTKVIDTVIKNPNKVTIFAISNDENHERAIPVSTRRIVSEAFAGLSMIAVHENQPYAAISYATASLFRFADTLPMINVVRLMAVAKQMDECVLRLTDTVILPFYLMSMSQDPQMYQLHIRELSKWSVEERTLLLTHARAVTAQAVSFKQRFHGRYGVIRARMEDGKFVEKLCAVCGTGYLGEKLFKCSRCSDICYCSKTCQSTHWSEHKLVCVEK